MTYTEFIIEQIKDVQIGVPIYTADLAALLAKEYTLELPKAKAATSVAMKRIMDKGLCPMLRFYRKGIYYLTTVTFFGELDIEDEYLIQHKYLENDMGYVTDYEALHLLGLTTQLPAHIVICTNNAKNCLRKDKELDVFTRPPKTKITAANKRYLQLLDALELFDKAPVDAENPYVILHEYIAKAGLQYDKLLALADKYYPKHVIFKIAQIASAGGVS